jgi:hypothetical protein
MWCTQRALNFDHLGPRRPQSAATGTAPGEVPVGGFMVRVRVRVGPRAGRPGGGRAAVPLSGQFHGRSGPLQVSICSLVGLCLAGSPQARAGQLTPSDSESLSDGTDTQAAARGSSSSCQCQCQTRKSPARRHRDPDSRSRPNRETGDSLFHDSRPANRDSESGIPRFPILAESGIGDSLPDSRPSRESGGRRELGIWASDLRRTERATSHWH